MESPTDTSALIACLRVVVGWLLSLWLAALQIVVGCTLLLLELAGTARNRRCWSAKFHDTACTFIVVV